MKSVVLLFSLLLFFISGAARSLSANKSAKERVAVIGAGSAGIEAASVLAEKGKYDVVIFEQRPCIGGNSFRRLTRGQEYVPYSALWHILWEDRRLSTPYSEIIQTVRTATGFS